MRIHKFNFENEEVIQIYINKTESEDLKIIEQINKFKKENSNIAIFVSGENKTIGTIKEILNYEKTKILTKK